MTLCFSQKKFVSLPMKKFPEKLTIFQLAQGLKSTKPFLKIWFNNLKMEVNMTLVKWNRGGKTNADSTPAIANRSSLLWPELFDSITWPSNLLQNFFNDDTGMVSGSNVPPVNVIEHDNELVFEMAAPGMRKENFKVELNDDQLRISYQNEQKPEEGKSGNHWRREYSLESFERRFSLPSMVMQDQVAASYTDGILKIVIPKKEEARRKPVREISIK
jgi:HSP20 family protein